METIKLQWNIPWYGDLAFSNNSYLTDSLSNLPIEKINITHIMDYENTIKTHKR